MNSSMHSEEFLIRHDEAVAPMGLLSQHRYDRYVRLTPRHPELSLQRDSEEMRES